MFCFKTMSGSQILNTLKSGKLSDTELKITDFGPGRVFKIPIKPGPSLTDKLHMVALWVLLGLIVSAASVSTLGAYFSVIGIAALFSGAAIAVMAMATSLEVAKFVLAAYLHQRWKFVNWIMKSYLLLAIVVLSGITSMGIFGFLSDAYQSASTLLEAENIKLESLKAQQTRANGEIARINKNIEEIPENRVTKRLKARAEAEPQIAALTKQAEQIDAKIAETNLAILEVKKRVGPLVYIAKVFNKDIDTIVKYFIIVFVFVFDPLAICLVIATSEALESRKNAKLNPKPQQQAAQAPVPAVTLQNPYPDPTHQPLAAETPLPAAPEDEVIQMRFVEDQDSSDKNVV